MEKKDRKYIDIKALLDMEEKLIAHIEKVQGIQTEINNDIYSRLSDIYSRLSSHG
jgi:flagellar motility protein MotE (MotC chaperone)